MLILTYFLFVYGVSYYITKESSLEVLKDYILGKATIQPMIYKVLDRLLYCQACVAFWIGWVFQFYVTTSIVPFHSFACFGLIHLIDKIKD